MLAALATLVVTGSWGWRDWSSWGASIAQAAIALLGFAVAIYELRRTRGAAEATASAAKRTQLLTLVQTMRGIERDLDASLPNRRTFAVRALNDWRASTTELHALLTKVDETPTVLLDDLHTARELAAQAKNDLQSPSRPSVTTATKKVRDAIAVVCDDAAQFIATIE